MRFFTMFVFFFTLTSCGYKGTKNSTKRMHGQFEKNETEVKLPFGDDVSLFSYLNTNGTEFLTYKKKNWIYLVNLEDQEVADSVKVLFDTAQTSKFGNITSYCFNGKDSLFLLLDDAIFFIKKRKIEKIIPINDLDTLQYKKIRFANLSDAPIYYDNKTNEIVGQVYCSKCLQTESSFYKQRILGHISLSSHALQLYNVTFPEKYIQNYYGFANHVYINSYDSCTLISFPCDEQVYLLNRHSNSLKAFRIRSIFQKNEAATLPLDMSNSREEKMKHLTTIPYYAEIRYNKYKNLYYRFFMKELPLKDSLGKYNTFMKKELVLTVFNSDYEIIGEYELGQGYADYFSFVGKSGLYVLYYPANYTPGGKNFFRILTFSE